MRVVAALFGLTLWLVTSQAHATLNATFAASKTNTIGSEVPTYSNGAGEWAYAGNTGAGGLRHFLIQFNVGSIPSGSTVVEARLTLELTRVAPTVPLASTQFRIRRLSRGWNAGTADGDINNAPEDTTTEGKLAPNVGSGATWNTYNGVSSWTTAGGDFVTGGALWTINEVLGSKTLTGNVSQNQRLRDDVHAWLNGTANNGWLIQGTDAAALMTAKQFNSRLTSPAPSLYVVYTLPQGATGCSNNADCTGSLYCTNGVCCNASSCPAPNECYLAGSCSAGSGTCSNALNNGAACTPDASVCTSDVCSGGACTHVADKGGTPCRAAPLECDLPESCVNGNSNCPADSKKAFGTACTSDGLDCTYDRCDGSSNSCQHPTVPAATLVCRSAAGVCDAPDYCNGISQTCPSDAKLGPADPACRAPSCDVPTSTAVLEEHCDGVGNGCPTLETQDCGPNGCAGDVCFGACTPGTCPLGQYCDAGVCKRKVDAGEPCGRREECLTPYCIDGVCCGSPCGGGTPGDCQACDVPGSEGTCTITPIGTLCRPSGGVCDLEEACDGSLTCAANQYESASTVCVPGSCSAGLQTVVTFCPGDGPTCPTPDVVACVPYVCGATECLTSCSQDVDCAVGYYCDLASDSCIEKQADGLSCDENRQCQSDYCVDGFCCDRACMGQCEACDVDPGVCQTVTSGQPHGDRVPCAGDGDICNGVCDGSFTDQCAFPAAETTCRAPECVTGVATAQAVCDGVGSCPALVQVECHPYTCGLDSCQAQCVTASQCAEDQYCVGGLCLPRAANGASCSLNDECMSSFCTDGVCCNTPCSGQCQACAGVGNDGTCQAVAGDPVGGRAPCLSDGSVCSGTCDGKNTATCTYPSFGVFCRASECVADVATASAQCNGSGACPPEVRQGCGSQACIGNRCGNGCVVDIDCGGSQFCLAGVCQSFLPNGAACGDNDGACSSGSCVDGVCCNTTCDGQCEACNVAGSVGDCVALAGEPPRGTRPRCASDGSACGGICAGQRDRCGYPGEETLCLAASCTSGVASLETTCIGTGRCPAPIEQSCGGSCSGALCAGGCVQDADCAGGEWCSGGVCQPLRADATRCTASAQCASGFCVDGYCCAAACSGQCQACDVPGSLGLCSPVLGAPHGGRPACGGSGPCAATCNGSICEFPSSGEPCGDRSCRDGVALLAAACTGNGSCAPGQQINCDPFACNADRCADTCTDDTDCAPGTICGPSQSCIFAGTTQPSVDGGAAGAGGMSGVGGAAGAGGVIVDAALGGSGGSVGGAGGAGGFVAGAGGVASAGAPPTTDPDAGAPPSGVPVDGGIGDAGPAGSPSDPSGCGCHVPARSNAPTGLGALMLLLAAAAARRSETGRPRRGA